MTYIVMSRVPYLLLILVQQWWHACIAVNIMGSAGSFTAQPLIPGMSLLLVFTLREREMLVAQEIGII